MNLEIKKAVNIIEDAVIELASESQPRMSTIDLKKKMDTSMILHGAIGFRFESSIGFARGTRRPPGIIKHKDMLILDVGGRVPSGYCSNMGRNIPITMDSEVEEFLNLAVIAHKDSIKSIRSGVIASSVLEESNRINVEHVFDPMVRCELQIGLECHDYTMPFAPNFGPIETDKQPLKQG